MRSSLVIILAVLILILPACQMNERLSGTLFGAGGGAVIGGLLGGSFAGGLIGGLAGGVAGYLVGDYLADRRERCEPPCAPQPCDPCPPTYAPAPCAPAPCVQPMYAPQPCPQPVYQPQPCAPYGYAPAGYVTPSYGGAPRVMGARARDTDLEQSRAAVARGRAAETLPEAQAAYEQAIRLAPHNADAWNQLGLVRNAAGDRAGAQDAFRAALQADPHHYAAQQNLSWAR